MEYEESSMTKRTTSTTFEDFIFEWGEVDYWNQPFMLSRLGKEVDMYIYQPRKESVYVITIIDGSDHIRKLRSMIKQSVSDKLDMP